MLPGMAAQQPRAPVRVHPASAADFAILRDLLLEGDRQDAAALPAVCRVPDPPGYTDAELGEIVANDRCLLLVAEATGRVVGFVEASVRDPEESYEAPGSWCAVHHLAVCAARRRRGIGTALLRAVEAWARRRGLPLVRLEVFEHNAGARALYERLGYATLWRHLGKPLAPAVPATGRPPTSR